MPGSVRFLTRNDRAYRREKIISAYQRGACSYGLASTFGLSREHIRRVLRDSGVKRRWKDGW